MDTSETPNLDLCLESSGLARFFYLLQRGFQLRIKVGLNVEATLTRELGLAPDLLDKIQTVFLNGKAVDDLESTAVEEGSILALSAAMPGLVGATLRRGGYYAAMRSQITAAETREQAPPQDGMVTVKLFNLLIPDLAPILLERGILIGKQTLRDFLAAQPRGFWACCRTARIDGRDVQPEGVATWHWPDTDDLIRLRVTEEPTGFPSDRH